MKSAKSLSGRVFSYKVQAAGQFRKELSQETGIPMKMLKLVSEELGVLKYKHKLSTKEIYGIFVDNSDRLREWIPVEFISWKILSRKRKQ